MKTVLEKLLETYPTVKMCDGKPSGFCPDTLDKNYRALCEDLQLTDELCINCWNQEIGDENI